MLKDNCCAPCATGKVVNDTIACIVPLLLFTTILGEIGRKLLSNISKIKLCVITETKIIVEVSVTMCADVCCYLC